MAETHEKKTHEKKKHEELHPTPDPCEEPPKTRLEPMPSEPVATPPAIPPGPFE